MPHFVNIGRGFLMLTLGWMDPRTAIWDIGDGVVGPAVSIHMPFIFGKALRMPVVRGVLWKSSATLDYVQQRASRIRSVLPA